MDDGALKQLKQITEPKEFLNFIKPYYPTYNIKEFSIEEVEKALFHTLIKIIGKIMLFSPVTMRNFLRTYLLKYEIINIKQIILGSIVGLSFEEKSNNTNFLVEKYLENTGFIKDLIQISNLDEIQLFMRGTRYHKAVKEGILYFKNTHEIFVLEAFLEQLYYKTLVEDKKKYAKKENQILSTIIDCITEIYNLNMIYRGIKNNIDRKLLVQFLIKNYLFLSESEITNLLHQENIAEFLELIDKYFKKKENIYNLYKLIKIKREHFIWSIEGFYFEYFFKKFYFKIGDINYSTIFRIIEVILKKEKEIRFNILPNIVKLFHEKFESLQL